MATNMKLVSHKDEVLAEFKRRKATALEAIGLIGENNTVVEIQIMDAIDTGNLMGSISHATDENSAYIGTNVDYAIWVHIGARGTTARPFLERAVTDFRDDYKEAVENYMRGR